jgi:hypothetical protein
VAIHAPAAGSLYRADSRGASGGAELQAFYLARALAERGLRVAHIVTEVPPRRQLGCQVDLVAQIPRTRGPRGTRSIPSIWQALSRTDASVYVQRSAGAATGVVGAFARAERRRFVYSLSSAADLARGLLPPSHAAIKEAGLLLADCVVTQTQEQLDVAVHKLGKKVRLIRSFCEPLSLALSAETFLWIGGLIDYKDPLAYLDLAERVPEARFLMVASPRPGWDQLAEEVGARARLLPNVELARPLPRSELLALYAQAVAVVGTSTFEGFPNTFMEAWAAGVPALSLSVDPDGVIARHGLGAVANGSIDQLAELARGFWRRRAENDAGTAAQEYIRREHHPVAIGDAWMDLISGLLG